MLCPEFARLRKVLELFLRMLTAASADQLALVNMHGDPQKEIFLCCLTNVSATQYYFEKHDFRNYVCFKGFERDPFRSLDMSSMFKWINKHKKNREFGLRAR